MSLKENDKEKLRKSASIVKYAAVVCAILCYFLKFIVGMKLCLVLACISLLIEIVCKLMLSERNDEAEELTILRKVVRDIGGLIILLLILFTA